MSMLPDLRCRNRQPELMDQPDLEPDRFVGALVGLRRINRVTRSARILWPDLGESARRHSGRTIRVLDVACGGGDVVVDLWRRARRTGLPMELDGCDISPLAVQHAQDFAVSAGAKVSFFALDITKDDLPDGYDVIMCSFFLHHLPGRDASEFLRQAAAKARDRVLVHDLARSAAGYLFAKYGVLFLLCNDVCRVDGPRSVEAAFTPGEAEALLREAGLDGGEVAPRFPYRYLLRWVKP